MWSKMPTCVTPCFRSDISIGVRLGRQSPSYFSYPLGLVRFRGIQSGRNNKCMKKIMIWTRIYSRSEINLPIMIGRIRDHRVVLVAHLLTSGLIPSLLVYLS
jgi:hypothetical protein